MRYYLLLLSLLIPDLTRAEDGLTLESSMQTQGNIAQQQDQNGQKAQSLLAPHKTPEEIQAELNAAQAKYEHALKLFNPWYTGPLITPSASMVPPGHIMMQPYLFFTDTYANYDSDRHVVDRPNLFSLKVLPVLFQTGITQSVDTTVIMSAVENWSKGKSGGGFNDITWALGFCINQESLYVPKFKFVITQSFPTGKYQKLSRDGLALDGTGAGAWQTTFTFTAGKVVFWNTLHPMNLRFAIQGTLSTPVHVRSFNVYGGGHKTSGTVHPGNAYNADLGLEISITQPWVAALDIVYNWQNKTTFHGKPGFNADGTPAAVGGGYNDQLSLAPAIEYNFSDSMGVLAGIWFTCYGRNAGDFASGILSWYWYY
jgi:hypothetical protein